MVDYRMVPNGDQTENFPMIMVSSHKYEKGEQVILAIGVKVNSFGNKTYKGTNLTGNGHPMGTYSEDWSYDFKKWDGEIKLKNGGSWI